MGCGLWLPESVAGTLVHVPHQLRSLLDAHGLFLYTLNGFPFGDFHRDRVKEAVYDPGWDQPERLQFSLNLARILADCLPDGVHEGTISTVPLGFAPGWNQKRQTRALRQLCVLVSRLAQMRVHTGRSVRVCLEPEPGCVLETTDQVIHLFDGELRAAAAACGVPEHALQNHLGICLDVCHQAVMFEDPGQSLERLTTAGVPVGKIQISSALTVPRPDSVELALVLRDFAEPRYLHQIRTPTPEGHLIGAMDLADILSATFDGCIPKGAPWHIHFHVPLQCGDLAQGALGTTQDAIQSILDQLARDRAHHPHLEVETYTWEVLPAAHRPKDPPALTAGLATELEWLESQMRSRNLLIEEPE